MIKKQTTSVDDAGSKGGIEIPKDEKIASLKSLGATLNFIDCWLKNFQHNNQVI